MSPASAHIVPFAAWLALMFLLEKFGVPTAWAYAIRAGLCLGLLVWCRPWRWYEKPKLQHLPLALAVGLGVWALWIFFESACCPVALSDLYVKWAVRPFGEPREAVMFIPYAPEICGWPLSLVRLAGSAFVIAVIEEFFWRGFLYRWMSGGDFLRVDAGRFDIGRFLLVAVVFGFEHDEWLAGIAAGLAYGWLYVKTRDIWAACAAHAVTNLALGLYVLKTGTWQFW